MKAAVISFPGSNCDQDAVHALQEAGYDVSSVWHASSDLPATDLVVLPGGFSYGDHLRSGAIAARSPIMKAVRDAAGRGVPVIGICNGFQVLTEAGLLPGALLRNSSLHFTCKTVQLKVENTSTAFTHLLERERTLSIPVAHGEGRYHADDAVLEKLEAEGRIAFRYHGSNPNGSLAGIAGIVNEAGNVLGMMPHPERATSSLLGSSDGLAILAGPLQARS
jgi:phosphoribosylformylglycinamidine synthase I